tara:strand:+ start:7950 stop:8408 length:459 start_codon:yes stop_codon:yes gene_type:complete
MANVNHSTLTDPYLHEPKGAYAAAANKVYVSDGSNSGAWTALGLVISGTIEDIGTASTVHVPIPFAGTISKIVTVLEAAITGANAIVTVKNSSAASMGTLTITQASSAAGDVDTLSPSSNNTVTANSFITVATDGGPNNAIKLRFVVTLDRS